MLPLDIINVYYYMFIKFTKLLFLFKNLKECTGLLRGCSGSPHSQGVISSGEVCLCMVTCDVHMEADHTGVCFPKT